MQAIRLDCMQLNAAPFKELYRLTLFPGSGMWIDLHNAERSVCSLRKVSYAILAYRKKQIVGWAIVQGARFSKKGLRDATLSVFVRPVLRRRGIGTALVRKARSVWKNLADKDGVLSSCSHDKRSRCFYESFNGRFRYRYFCRADQNRVDQDRVHEIRVRDIPFKKMKSKAA